MGYLGQNPGKGSDSVTTENIEDGGVTTSDIANSAVTTAKIEDGAVTNAKVATDAIDTDQLVDDSVTNTKVADEVVVSIRQIPQNSQSSAYTLSLSDAGRHILHPSADTTARTWTIPANASVAFPVGTAVTFVNQDSAGVITITITSDTMRLAGDGDTGNRTLEANGIATALKVTSTEWIISGSGLS